MIIQSFLDSCDFSSPFPPWHRRGCAFIIRSEQQEFPICEVEAGSLVCQQSSNLNSTYASCASCHYWSCCTGLREGGTEMAHLCPCHRQGAMGSMGSGRTPASGEGASGRTDEKRAKGIATAGRLMELWGPRVRAGKPSWKEMSLRIPVLGYPGRKSFCRFDHLMSLGFMWQEDRKSCM